MENKKPITNKETKKVSKINISEEMKDKTLQELKKEADKSFKNANSNKKKIIGVTLGAIGLAAIGTVTPIAVYNANKEISVLVQSVNVSADKYKVKVKQGTKIKDIKIVELEGYEFVGYFKDEACTKPYKLTDELKKATTIYASYKQKSIKLVLGDKSRDIPYGVNITIGEAIKQIETLEYETSGHVYLDEACTLEADLNATITANTTLYTKAATIDQLSFIWDETTSGWRVSAKDETTSGDIVVPAKYSNGTKNGSVTIIGQFTYIDNTGQGAMWGCNITSIEIPNSVKIIDDRAFYFCNILKSINIPNSVTTIGRDVFTLCFGLTEIEIPNSVTSIGTWAFHRCTGLTSITIPNSIKIVEDCTFSDCQNLVEVNIPNSITTIGNRVFEYCENLTSITIPDSVTTIGEEVFYGCRKLKTVIIDSVTIVKDLDDYRSYGDLLYNASTVYIKTGLDVSNSTYLTSNYTKQAMTDKDGYDKWVKNF